MDKPLPSAARENLRGRIARLEAIFRNLAFPVVVVATDGTIRLMNAAAAAYLEGTPEDFVATSIRQLVPEQAATYLDRIRRILKNRRVEHFETLLELPTGKKWFHSVWRVADNSCAAPDEVLVAAFDITQQKQIEKELRLAEGHLRSMMENATDFALYRLVHDETQFHRLRVVFASPSIRDILGISDPMKFESWFAKLHPEEVEKIKRANLKAFETHRFNEQFRVYNEKTAEWRWIHAVSCGGADPGDVNRYVNGILFDITDQKHAEAALRRNQEHLRSLSESAANFAVYRLVRNPVDPQQMQVVFVSPSAGAILGVRDPMDFESWFENMHPEDDPRIRRADAEAFQSGRFDEQFRTFDAARQQWRWVHSVSTGSPDSRGRNRYVNGIMIDITERKAIEEKLLRYEKQLENRTRNLEEANTALRVVIEQRKRDVIELEEKIASNVEVTILPFIKKLKKYKINTDQKECVELIESNLKSITSPFSTRLSSAHVGLTPTEIQVASLVKMGYTTKQIARRMNVSVKTTDVHRLRIRKKLGIDGKKINLRTFLLANLDS